jgi:hypothetical protein
MVYINPEFVQPTIPENESDGGTEVDSNVLAGKSCRVVDLLWVAAFIFVSLGCHSSFAPSPRGQEKAGYWHKQSPTRLSLLAY